MVLDERRTSHDACGMQKNENENRFDFPLLPFAFGTALELFLSTNRRQ